MKKFLYKAFLFSWLLSLFWQVFALNLTPIFLNKIQDNRNYNYYIIKDSDWKFKLVNKNSSIINKYPDIITNSDDAIIYKYILNYPWHNKNNPNTYEYSIAVKNNDKYKTQELLNSKINIWFIEQQVPVYFSTWDWFLNPWQMDDWLQYSYDTGSWLEYNTYVRTNSNDEKDKNKNQIPFFADIYLIRNLHKIYNLVSNYNYPAFADTKIYKYNKYYDVSSWKEETDTNSKTYIIYANTGMLGIKDGSDINFNFFIAGNLYLPLLDYNTSNNSYRFVSKKQLENLVNGKDKNGNSLGKQIFASPFNYTIVSGNNYNWSLLNRNITKESYAILPGAPLISVPYNVVSYVKTGYDIYFKYWKNILQQITDVNDASNSTNLIKDITLDSDNKNNAKKMPTVIFGADNEFENSNVKETYNGWIIKYKIGGNELKNRTTKEQMNILNMYGFNIVTQSSIKPLYLVFGRSSTADSPINTLVQNISYFDKFPTDGSSIDVGFWILAITRYGGIWKYGWILNTTEVHNDEFLVFQNGSENTKWTLYSVTFPAVFDTSALADKCADVIQEWFKQLESNNSNKTNITDTIYVNCDINYNFTWNSGNTYKWIIEYDWNNWTDIEIPIALTLVKYDKDNSKYLYYQKIWNLDLTKLNKITLKSKDSNGNVQDSKDIEYHIWTNKIMPSLNDTGLNSLSVVKTLISDNIYSGEFAKDYLVWLNKPIYWYPVWTENNVNPIDELYTKDGATGKYFLKDYKDIKFVVNMNTQPLVDNFISTNFIDSTKNLEIYHDLIFYNSNYKYWYYYNWDQIIDDSKFKSIINNNFKYNNIINWYHFDNINIFNSKTNPNFQNYIKNYYDKEWKIYLRFDGSWTDVVFLGTKERLHFLFNNFLFSHLLLDKIKNDPFFDNDKDYKNFFKDVFSYWHLDISKILNVLDLKDIYIKSIQFVTTQPHLNIKNQYKSEKNKSEEKPISYWSDIYKLNTLEDFVFADFLNITTINHLKSIYYNLLDRDSNNKFKSPFISWFEADLDDISNSWTPPTASKIWYYVRLSSWVSYPFFTILNNINNFTNNEELLTNSDKFSSSFKIKYEDNGGNLSWTGKPNWSIYSLGEYNIFKELDLLDKRLINLITNEITYNKISNISTNWLQQNLLAWIFNYVNNYSIWNNITLDRNKFQGTDTNEKELNIYKNTPMKFRFTTQNKQVWFFNQWFIIKLWNRILWYDWTNDSWIINNSTTTYLPILKFSGSSDKNNFITDYSSLISKILGDLQIASQKIYTDCSDNSNKSYCVHSKIESATAGSPLWIFKWTSNNEIDLRNKIKNYLVTQIDQIGNLTSCSLEAESNLNSVSIPKYIPSKNTAEWKLTLVQEWITPFLDGNFIECEDDNGYIYIIPAEILLPADKNDKVYYLPESSNWNYIKDITDKIKKISWLDDATRKNIANDLSDNIINKLFWDLGSKRFQNAEELVFKKFNNSPINGIYYQILTNLNTWNDLPAQVKPVKFKLDDILTYNVTDTNFNSLNTFKPNKGEEYFLNLISAKKLWIWTPVFDFIVKSGSNWLYDYSWLFEKFDNHLSNFFEINDKTTIEDNMVNKLKPEVKKLLIADLERLVNNIVANIESNNKSVIVKNITGVLLSDDDFKSLYWKSLYDDIKAWSMFFVLSINITDLNNGDKHLIFPYILNWSTIIKDYQNWQEVEFLPFKMDLLRRYVSADTLWENDLGQLIPTCLDKQVCIVDYEDVKNDNKVTSIIGNLVTIRTSYSWTMKSYIWRDDSDAFDFNFTIDSSNLGKDNSLLETESSLDLYWFDLDLKKWYLVKASEKRFRFAELNAKLNISWKTWNQKFINAIKKSFYRTFNFSVYLIKYDTKEVKINTKDNKIMVPMPTQASGTPSYSNINLSSNFINSVIGSNDNIVYKVTDDSWQVGLYNKFFDYQTSSSNDFINVYDDIVDSNTGDYKWMLFTAHDKLLNFNITLNAYKDTSNNNYDLKWLIDNINNLLEYKQKWYEGKIDNNAKDLTKWYAPNGTLPERLWYYFNSIIIPFKGWSIQKTCLLNSVYLEEDNPSDKSIYNWIYTTLWTNNGTVQINWVTFDGEITNSNEELDNWIHTVRLYVYNNSDNDCESITIKSVNISWSNIQDDIELDFEWNKKIVKNNTDNDISDLNIVLNKGEYKEIDLIVNDISLDNYQDPTLDIQFGYTDDNDNLRNSNKLSFKFKWKESNNPWICSKVKCYISYVTPDDWKINLTYQEQTNVKYQIICQNNADKDVDRIDYTIKYSNTNLVPSFIWLDSDNSFSNKIDKLKQWQMIKWYWTSDEYTLIDPKLFIMNNIKSNNINFSTTVSWNYNIILEDGTQVDNCSIPDITWTASMNESARESWQDEWLGLNNYNECYIVDKSDEYNTIPYDVNWFINSNTSDSYIKGGYLYLKFYKLQQSPLSNDYHTYQFDNSYEDIYDLSTHWWTNYGYYPYKNTNVGNKIWEYNKVVYKATIELPSYIRIDADEVNDRIKNQLLKIFWQTEDIGKYLNWYKLKVIERYWSLTTDSNWNTKCSGNYTKTFNYQYKQDQYSNWWNGITNNLDDNDDISSCIYGTSIEIKLYLNTELYGLQSNHQAPEIKSTEVYSIIETSDYNNKKAWYTVSLLKHKSDAENLFKNNPYAFFDDTLGRHWWTSYSNKSSNPMIELWVPITIKKPQTTNSTSLNNKITWWTILSNEPIVCKSDLEYNKLGYRWTDTSNKQNEVTHIPRWRECDEDGCRCETGDSEYGNVWHRVNLNWYWIYEYGNNYENDRLVTHGSCSDYIYDLFSGWSVPETVNNDQEKYLDNEGNPNYQIVLKHKEDGNYLNETTNDRTAIYRFYPTLLLKGWTQYVWTYNIEKSQSKKYDFMSDETAKENFGAVISPNDADITSTYKEIAPDENFIIPLNKCYNLVDNKIDDITNTYEPDERWYCLWWYKPLFYKLLIDPDFNKKYINEDIITRFNNDWKIVFDEDKFVLYIYNASDNSADKLYLGANNDNNLLVQGVGWIFFTNDIEDLSDNSLDVTITSNIIKADNDYIDNSGSVKSNNLTLFVNGNLYIGKNVSAIQANLIVNGDIIIEDSNVPLTIQWYIYVQWKVINNRKQVNVADSDPLSGNYIPSVRIIDDPVFNILDLPYKDKIIYLEKNKE